MYVQDLYPSPTKKVFDQKVDLLFDTKIETHTKLAKEWGTGDKTCRPYITNETEVSKLLKAVYNEEKAAIYIGGSMEAGDYILNENSFTLVEGYFLRKEGNIPYNKLEKYWWSKCYIKYKTPKDSFYKESDQYIKAYRTTHEGTK